MNRLRRIAVFSVLVAGCVLPACGPGRESHPTLTPADAGTPDSATATASVPLPASTPTVTPVPIPGIGTPILVEGVGILFTGAELFPYFTIGDQTATPVASAEMYLIVSAVIPEEYLANAMAAGIQAWKVTLNGSIPCAYFASQFGMFNRVRQGKLTWVFAVGLMETSFVINLPGGTDFNLAPLL